MSKSVTSIRKLLTACMLAAALVGARPADAQILSGAVGAVGGIGAGGYVTLAVVVLRAQYGHYLHDVNDLLGWQSVPVLLGAGVGTAVGVWDADRMVTGFAYGTAGVLVGGTVGYLLGPVIWKRPEGKWAGAAIGAGMGMAASYFLGVFKPIDGIAPSWLGNSDKAVIPINLTISVP
ncbi:MAG TPA: glycine zipper 2TM domain-containing protein [Longimicrobiales bacterium]